MAERIKIKARPVIQRIKIQYEGEELSIRELVDRLKMYKALYRFWQNEAEKATKVANPVKHGQWKLVGKIYDGKADIWKCSVCGRTVMFLTDDCPYCGAKMDGGKS